MDTAMGTAAAATAFTDGSRIHGFSQADVLLFRAKLSKELTRAPDEKELTYFLAFVWRHRLDPMMDHVTAQQRSGKMAITVGIGGLVLMAERSGVYAGCDAVEYGPQEQDGKTKYPVWAKATVYRMVQGQRCPFTSVVLWDEYAGRNSGGSLKNTWASLPYTMLGKVATAHALRMGFSANVGRNYIPEELDQSENLADAPQQPSPAEHATAALAFEGATEDEALAAEEPDDAADDLPAEPDAPAPAPAPARTPSLDPGERVATQQQIASLRKLCAKLGKPEPDPDTLTYNGAGELIQQYSRAVAQRIERERQERETEPAYN